MCGITGICNIHQPIPIDISDLEKMTYSLNHRGSDDSGVYIDDWIGLGHSRLSIIDLTSGQQPIHNEDNTIWITYNGEIFNYPELRKELSERGHKFYTTSDTEVIIHLYEEKAEECLKYLNGQFAFAIWDSRKKELFLARDRVGILPLFYYMGQQQLIFASEIKALFNYSNIERQLDLKSLNQIFNYWSTLPGRTVFNGVNEIPPGHYLKLSNKKINLKRYWDYPFPEDPSQDISKKNLLEDLLNLLIDSIRIRLRADVSVGSYLSGGLDSSGITTLIKKYFNNELKTFGIEFDEDDYDEGQFQSIMIDDLKINHLGLKVSNEQIGQYFEGVICHIEKPVLRAAPVPLFLLSKLVNENNLKVVLTGEGADEIFGGYNIFKEAKIRRFWAANPDSKVRPLFLKKLYPYIFKDKRLSNTLSAFFKKGITNPDNPFFSHEIRWGNTEKLKNYFVDDIKQQHYQYEDELIGHLPDNFNEQNYFTKTQYLELMTFMSGYLLSAQGDRVSMANSVEIRLPYLDHRIIEFMANVPVTLKLNGLNEKFLLKNIFRPYLPEEIISRPKNPYRSPIKKALLHKNCELNEKYGSEECLKAHNIFNYRLVNKLIGKAKLTKNFSELDNMALAGIFSTQIIFKNFVQDFKKAQPPAGYFKTFFDNRNIFRTIR
jgi:asparagine synthase (glutamine-hydrolysing)